MDTRTETQKEEQMAWTCPMCGGTEFSQDTDDFDTGRYDLFRCESCMTTLVERYRPGKDGDITWLEVA